jgi:hypothetical protein
MKKEILDIYSNYLICAFNYIIATGLSTALNKQISHVKNCSIKGTNLLNCVYNAGGVTLPIEALI